VGERKPGGIFGGRSNKALNVRNNTVYKPIIDGFARCTPILSDGDGCDEQLVAKFARSEQC
jgi:hypothetical protein